MKDATVSLFISKLFVTCWGMLLQVSRLGYLYLRQVPLGLYLAPQCVSDCFDPLEFFPLMFWLAEAYELNFGTLARIFYPKECVFVCFVGIF